MCFFICIYASLRWQWWRWMCDATIRHRGHGQVITFHKYCGIWVIVPHHDVCFWHDTPHIATIFNTKLINLWIRVHYQIELQSVTGKTVNCTQHLCQGWHWLRSWMHIEQMTHVYIRQCGRCWPDILSTFMSHSLLTSIIVENHFHLTQYKPKWQVYALKPISSNIVSWIAFNMS